ncbi:MAG: hypothetical protein Q8M94_06285 [Ignavibacteria bacterium]|nr:hypothetical protein [Ignavibacteria bacterium]
MLNATRLEQAIPFDLFTERTGLPIEALSPTLEQAASRGLIALSTDHWQVTALGRRYTNDLQILGLGGS